MPILLLERRGSVLILTLNRPEVMNALSSELALELQIAVADAGLDHTIRSIILTGSGGRAYCAGTDLKQRRGLSESGKWAQAQALWNASQELSRSPKAVISAISGWCLGGGLVLALYSDLRVASVGSKFGWPEMSLGAYPGAGAAIMLPRVVGLARAKEMFFTARNFDAHHAFEIGLIDKLVPEGDALNAALDYAREIEQTSPLGLAGVKSSVDNGADLPFPLASELDQKIRRPLEATSDYAEGIQAFFEKRKPRFCGE